MEKMHFLKYHIFRNSDFSIEWNGVLYKPHPDELWKADKVQYRSPFYAFCSKWDKYVEENKREGIEVTHDMKLNWYDMVFPRCKPSGFQKDIPRITVIDQDEWEGINKYKTKPEVRQDMSLANVASLYESRAVKPFEIAELRKRTMEIVSSNMHKVGEVLEGKTEWSNVQVRLFATLLDRVLPKIPSSYVNSHEQPKEGKRLNEMTREELEQIALTGRIPQTIDVSPISAFTEKADELSYGQEISDLDKDITAAEYLVSHSLLEKKAGELYIEELNKEKAEIRKKRGG